MQIRNYKKNSLAQGALEYLLMIGAAILVVAVVIIALSGVLVETKDQNTSQDYNNQLQDLRGLIGGSGNESGGGSSFSCTGDDFSNASLCEGMVLVLMHLLKILL